MAVIYQASGLPVGERRDALHAAFDGQTWPLSVGVDNADDVDHYMQAWEFGPASIWQANLTNLSLDRTEKHVRTGPADMFCVARQTSGAGIHDQFDSRYTVGTGHLMLVDMNQPYRYLYDGPAASQALYVPIEALNLPRRVVKEAATRLPASPVYELLSTHINELTSAGDSIAGTEAARTLGESSVELARTLIASAFDGDYARGMMAEVLLPRIKGYIRRHLADRDLTPDTIARAHDISTRKLFRLCGEDDFSLEQWVITHRLEGCRGELARAECRHLPIALIARRWGFGNPSYFARRFRAAYGMSPRAWRYCSASDGHRRV
ncbi:MAG: AraC family transcriptional regulator [Rhodococcus sp. (in: high G+C Gram-positive bacteria)]